MNNKEFIIELSQRTGYNIDSTQKLVRSIVEAIASRFDEGERVEIPDFGYFEVCNRRERIVVNPANGQRMIVPPKLVLVFKYYLSGANRSVGHDMVRLPAILGKIVDDYGLTEHDADDFGKQMFAVVSDGLASDGIVKVKRLGTFKSHTASTADKAVMGDGDAQSKADKVIFTPETLLRDRVNSPFAQFESVPLNDGVDFSAIDNAVDDTMETQLPETDATDLENTEGESEEETTAGTYNSDDDKAIEAENHDAEDKELITGSEDKGSESVEVSHNEDDSEELPQIDDTASDNMPHSSNENGKADININEAMIVNDKQQPVTSEKDKNANILEQTIDELQEKNVILKQENFDVKNENRKLKNSVSKLNKKLLYRNVACAVLSVLCIVMAAYFVIGYFNKSITLLPTTEEDLIHAENMAAIADSVKQVENEIKGNVVKHDSVKRVKATPPSHEKNEDKDIKIKSDAKAVSAKAISEKESFAQYEDDPRVRTGAYRIVGVAKTVTLAEGQTIESVSKTYLGPGMECYVEAINSKGLKPGDKVKIPALELKRAKKQK